jgi:tetratricopeptide (TPR) repeat protein
LTTPTVESTELVALTQAAEQNPGDFGAVKALAEALVRAGKPAEAVKHWQEYATLWPDPVRAAEALAQAARLSLEALAQPQQAAALAEQALALQPGMPEAQQWFRQALAKLGDRGVLAERCERWAAAAPPAEAAALLVEAASALEAERPARAALCLLRAARLEPSRREALTRARQLLLQAQQPRAAFQVLQEEHRLHGGDGLSAAFGELGHALSLWPIDADLARTAARTALALEPKQPRAEEVLAQLESQAQHWAAEVTRLESLAQAATDEQERAAASLRVAELHFTFGAGPEQAEKIQAALHEAAQRDPTSQALLAFLERQAEAHGAPEALAAELLQLVQAAPEGPARAELWVRVGRAQLQGPTPVPDALQSFCQAAALDPARSDASSLAAELHLAEGRSADASLVWEAHLAALPRGLRTADVRLHMARLALALPERAEVGREHVLQALRTDPGSAHAALALEPLFEDGEPQEQAEFWERTLPAVADRAERAKRLSRVASLKAITGGEPLEVVSLLARAVALAPDDLEAADQMLAWSEKANAWPTAARALRLALSGAKKDAQASLWRKLAFLMEEKRQQPEAALAAYRKLLALLPDDSDAQAQTARLELALGASEERIKDLEARVNAEADPAAQKPLLAELIARREAGEAPPEVRVALYRRMLALDSDDAATWEKLFRDELSQAHFEAAMETTEWLANLQPDRAAHWRVARADIRGQRLGQREAAIEELVALWTEGVREPELVDRLEAWAQSGAQTARLAALLLPHLRPQGDFRRTAWALAAVLPATPDLAEREALQLELARLQEQRLVDSRAAFTLLNSASREAPRSAAIAGELGRLAADLGRAPEVVRLWLDQSHAETLAEAAIDQAMRAAALAQQAQLPDRAIASFQAVLERSPSHAAAIAGLLPLLRTSGRWVEVEALLRARAAKLKGPDQIEALLGLAEACEKLNRPGEVASAIEQAIGLGADEEPLLGRLETALDAARRYQDLERVLARGVKLAESRGDMDKVSKLNLRRTRILEATLGDRDGALKGYAEILTARPADPEALASLEAMLNDPELRERAARALVPAYESTREYRRLVHALEVLADAAPAPADRVGALRRSAQVYSNDLRQPEMAFLRLANALKINAADAQLRLATRRAAEEAEQLDVYAEVVSECASLTAGIGAIPLHRELAEVCERRLNERPRAIAAYQRILVIDPQNLDALRGLHRLFRAEAAYGELARTCRLLAEVVYDDKEKASLLREASALFENQLKDLESAAAVNKRLCELDKDDKDAASTLDRLYEKLGRPTDLALALELRRTQEGPSPQGREFTFRLAELKRTQLGDLPAAATLFEQVLAADPAHVGTRNSLEAWVRGAGPGAADALKLLDPVLEKVGDHPKRIALREALLKGSSEETKARFYAEVRRIYERDLAQPDMAFMSACRSFSEGVAREDVAKELERLARDTNAYEELTEVYEDAFQQEADEERAEAYARRAAALRSQLGHTERAIELWRNLLQKRPGDREALDALTKLYEKSQNAQHLAEVYRQKASLATTPEERVQLLLQSAAARDQMSDEPGAVQTLREVLAIDPKNLKAWQQLDTIYPRLDKPREHADVLRALADLSEGPQRKGYLLRRASLLEKEADAHEAVDAYALVTQEFKNDATALAGLERMFAEEPVRIEVAKLLEPIYRAVTDTRRLADVLEARISAAGVEERKALLAEVAQLREALGQKPLAFALTLRLFRDIPDDMALRDHLERLAADTGSFEELSAAYQDELDRNAHPELAVGLWRSLAQLYAERLGSPEMAAKALEEVARMEPQDARVLDQLAKLYRRQNALQELVHVYRRQVALETRPGPRRNLLYELATLCEERLSDPAGAIEAYRTLLQQEPTDTTAMAALRKLLVSTERWDDLASHMEREAQLARDQGKSEEALDLTVRLGKLRATKLQDPRGSFDLYRAVLALKPGHAGAVQALEEMAKGEGPLRTEAALALEPVFNDAGDHSRLVQMLEARAVNASPAERSLLYRRVALTYGGPLGSPEMAFMSAVRALREVPDETESLDVALQFVDPAGLHEELEEVITEVLSRANQLDTRVALYRAQAKLCRGPLNDLRRAADAYLRILEIKPTDPEALDQLSVLLRDQGEFETLLEIMRRKLELAEDDAGRASLLLRMAELQDEKMRDPAGAIATLHRLLHEVQPDNRPALSRLDNLCVRQERWVELADVLQHEVQLADGAREVAGATALKLRLGQLRETKLQDRSGALALYKEILAGKPDHEDAIKRLEEMLGREPTLDEAAQALEGAYRNIGNIAKLAALLEQRAGIASDPMERKRLYMELATIRFDRQNRPELAFLALCRAFREDPADETMRRQLERAAAAAESEEELAALYEEELPRIRDELAASDIAYRTAVMLEKLERPDEALPFYEQSLTLDPEVGAQALPALDRFYRQQQKWDRLAEVLRRSADVAAEPRQKISLLQSLAQILDEKLGHPDRAAEEYERILQVDPKSMPALRGLEKLYDAAQSWDRLYRILEAQRDAAPPGERERVLGRMAQVSAHGLSNSDQSIQLYREVLERNPRSEQAFLALEGLYEEHKLWDELVDLLKRRLAFTVDPREIVRLSDKLGRTLHTELHRPDEAVAAFKAVLDRDPRHRKALEHLRDIHEANGKTEELVTMLRRLIPVQDDAAGVKQVRLKLAEVLSTANRREEALDAARRVLDTEPHVEADLLRAEALFRGQSAWADAVKAMELRAALAEQAKDVDTAVTVLFDVADLQLTSLKKREQALGSLEHLLNIDPRNRIAFEKLRQVARDVGDFRRYVGATDRFLPSVSDPAERLELLKESAEIQRGTLGQKDLAFVTYCRAFRDAPTDDEVRQALHQLAADTESWDTLADVYEEAAEAAARGPVAELLYTELAAIQDEHLDEPEAAEQSLRRVLEFDPANHSALDALGQMHSRRGKDSDYIASLEQKIEVTAETEERKRILREIARVYEEKQHNVEEALLALQRSLNLELDRPTLDVMCAILRREQRWSELASQLLRARDLAQHPAERAELQAQVAGLHETKLQDEEAAIAGYRQALEFDPTHRESINALEQLYTRLDRSAELLGVYNQQLEFVQDTKERIKILFKAASIWEEKYQNLANADSCLHSILAVDMRNLQAIKGLERLKRAQGKWDELVQIYDRHLALTTKAQAGEQVELLLAQGEVWYAKLSRVDRAVEVYTQALKINPASKEAMHALGVLYERSGNWPDALEMLSREAELEKGALAVELFHRLGKINEEMLQDMQAAAEAYHKALERDGSYLPSIKQLKGLYKDAGQQDAYLEMLTQEAKATLDPEDKTSAWVSVADHHREVREDLDQAAVAYEEALKVTPDALAAAQPLADITVGREQWVRAEQVLDIVCGQLTRKAADDDAVARTLCRQVYRLGYVCQKLGKGKKALEAYRKAYELDASYLPALEGLAHLLVQAGELEEANRVYQTILLQHKDDLPDLEVVEIYWQLGDISLKLKQADRAANFFEKALARDPGHEPSQVALVQLSEELGQYDKALALRRKLTEVQEGEELFQTQRAIARLCRDHLHDPFTALDALNAALKIRPQDLDTLEQTLALYQGTHQGDKAVEALERVLAHPDVAGDALSRRRGYYTLGEICRDELKDDDRAVAAFNMCLEVDPRFIKAFSAIEALLVSRKQWQKLEQNYAAMIRRLPKTDDTMQARMALWRTLADLYLRVLKNPAAAVQALEVVTRSAPDDIATLEQFAALAAEQPTGQEKAIAAYRKALPATANPVKVVGALAKLHALRKEYDEAFVAAGVVVHLLGEGGPEEREILTKLTPWAKRREQAQRNMTDRMWTELLYHPKVKGPVGDILGLLYSSAGTALARKHIDFGIDPKKHGVDLASAEELAINQYKYVLRALGIEAIELFSPFLIARRGQLKGTPSTPQPGESELLIDLVHTSPLALKAGGALFKQVQQKELQYLLARTLTFTRPELALAKLLPIERLEALFQAAIVLVAPRFKVTADPRMVEVERQRLERSLTQPAGVALAKLTNLYLKEQSLGDIRAFIEGAELTANRAGLLIAGSIETAKAAMEKDNGMAVKLPLRAKIRDLMVFSLSAEFAQLREALGVNVEVVLPGQPQQRQ